MPTRPLNRSAWLLAEPDYEQPSADLDQVPPNILRMNVNPFDPALGQIDVRYAAFSGEPPTEIASTDEAAAAGASVGSGSTSCPE